MAYINTAIAAKFAQVDIIVDLGEADAATAFAAVGAAANTVTVPALQEITMSATPGIFRWKQLDSLSEQAITTSSTNSLSCTLVLDDTTFFTTTGTTPGLFNLINNKKSVFFRLYFAGDGTNQGTTETNLSGTYRYVEGKAYLSGLAPTVSPDSPVWTTPVTFEVVGDYNLASLTV